MEAIAPRRAPPSVPSIVRWKGAGREALEAQRGFFPAPPSPPGRRPAFGPRVMSAACRQVWMFCQHSCVYDHPQMCIQEHTVPTAEINAGLTAGQPAHTGERKKENKNCLMLFINYTLADEKYISPPSPSQPPNPFCLGSLS